MIWLVLLALLLAVVIGMWVVGKLIGLILLLALAGIIGAAMGALLNYKGSFLYSIGAGLVGAVIGTVLANILNLPGFLGFELFNLPVLWTAGGAAIVVAITKVMSPGDDTRRIGGGNRGLLR